MENKEWFLYVVDHHEGPFSADEVKKLIKKGQAKNSSYVWKDGLEDWMLMADVTELGPGGSKSDGHGAFSFLTKFSGLLKRKPKPGSGNEPHVPGAAAAALAAGDGASISTGPDISDVSASDSVWCLNSNKEFSGPFSLKNIVRKVNDGNVAVEDGVWKEGWSSFVRIANIPGFMEGVKPDVLAGKTEKKKKKKVSASAKGAAAAMGMGSGGAAVAGYSWYKSRKVKFLLLVAVPATIYQAVVMGFADPLLEKIPGSKEKIKALDLKPLPVNKLARYIFMAQDMAMPLIYSGVAKLPEPIQAYFSMLQLPEGVELLPNDVENLREVSSSDLKGGVRVASALPPGDEMNPGFYIASNAPSGTNFTVALRGKEGTLLNATGYEKTFSVEITKHLGSAPRFTSEGGKPLPKGEYILLIYESDKQTDQAAMKALAESPKRAAPMQIPTGKSAFVVDTFFLGGKKDATYLAKLKDYQTRVRARAGTEALELKELALLLEEVANKSYTKFTTYSPMPPGPQRKTLWAKYHADYAKISGQIKATLSKLTPEARKELALPQLYAQTEKTYELTERLHQAENDVIEKGGAANGIAGMGGEVATAISDLKTAIFKVIK
ncbi:MAG: DUF4339 domain-containing protein [Deltaproteobacteria bacterium]|nr:DUF4339 domain-containing protein [Deltaproteobacteria bacterium]